MLADDNDDSYSPESHMRFLTSLILLCLFTANTAFARTPYHAAQTDLDIPDPSGQRPLQGWLWYPTQADSAE